MWRSFVIYLNVESLGCIPETNRVLYDKYISIKKKEKWMENGHTLHFECSQAGGKTSIETNSYKEMQRRAYQSRS